MTRRRLVLGCTCGTCAILSSLPVYGSDVVHPRNGIRDRVFADAMNHMDMYEEAIRPVKIALFSTLREDLENTLSDTRDDKYSIADIGIGTGPNVKFYDREKAFLQAVEPKQLYETISRDKSQGTGFSIDISTVSDWIC